MVVFLSLVLVLLQGSNCIKLDIVVVHNPRDLEAINVARFAMENYGNLSDIDLELIPREYASDAVNESIWKTAANVENMIVLNFARKPYSVELAEGKVLELTLLSDVLQNIVRDFMIHRGECCATVLSDGYANFNGYRDEVDIHTMNGHPRKDIRAQLKQLRKAQKYIFYAFGSTTFLQDVLWAAKENGMLGSRYTWTLVTKDLRRALNCNRCSANVTFVEPMKSRMFDRKNSQELNVENLGEMFFFDSLSIVLEATDVLMSTANGSLNVISLRRAIKNVANEYHGKFGNYEVETTRNVLFVDMVMKVSKLSFNTKNSSGKSIKIGEYVTGSQSGTLMMRSSLYSDGDGVIRILANELSPPYITRKVANVTFPQTSFDNYEGFLVDFFERIQRELGSRRLRYEVFEGSSTKFANLGYAGFVDIVAAGEADLALSDISVTAEREMKIAFTSPFMTSAFVILIKKQSKKSSTLFKYITIFEGNVWIAFFAAFVASAFILRFFDTISPFSARNVRRRQQIGGHVKKGTIRVFDLKESLWFCLISLTPQGGAGPSPRPMSSRIFVATWWVLGFVILAAYQANMAAFLAVSRTSSRIESLDNLASQYKVRYGPVVGSSTQAYFAKMAQIEAALNKEWTRLAFDTSIPEEELVKMAVWEYPIPRTFTRMWAIMSDLGFPLSIPEALASVFNGTFALITDEVLATYWTLTNCDIEIVGEPMARLPLAFGVQKNSPLKELLDPVIEKLKGEMVVEELYSKWWTESSEAKQCQDARPRSHGLNLSYVGGIYAILVVGFISSLIVLLVENAYYAHQETFNYEISERLGIDYY